MGILQGLPLVSNAKITTLSGGGVSPVTGNAIANTTTIYSLQEFNLTESKYSGLEFYSDNLIPLRKNYSTTYGKTWSKIGGPGAIGYCEPVSNYGTQCKIKLKALIEYASGNTNSSSPYTYKVGIFDDHGNLLGWSNEVNVSKTGYYDFVVDPFARMSTGFYKTTLKFKWYYKKQGSEWTLSNDIEVPLYNFPSKPKLPWSCEKGKTNNPWTDVLDLLWEKSENDPSSFLLRYETSKPQIAEAVTYIVNSKLGLIYDDDAGRTVYLNWNDHEYNLTRFLSYLKETPQLNLAGDEGLIINCSDCACAVTTFSNLLGCDLYNIVFGKNPYNRTGAAFRCNKVLTLRSDANDPTWDYPFSYRYNGTEGWFGYHEISMVGTYGNESNIYDACLKVNTNIIKNRYGSSRSALLPANTRYSSKPDYPEITGKDDNSYIGADDAQYYIEWLVYNNRNNLNDTKLQFKRKQEREITII